VRTRAAYLLFLTVALGCTSREDTRATDTAARPDTGAITGAGSAPHAPLIKVDTGAARTTGDSAARQKRP
jgi:hypothetical protein